MQAAIDKFEQYLSHRYPGRSTTKHYMSDLAIFCTSVGAIDPKDVTIQMIDQFVQTQSEQGLKPATINRRLSTISSFFEYLISEHEEAEWQNPVHWRRHSIRPGQHIPRDVSEQTVEALLAVIEDKRDRAMVLLMVSAGLRIGEVVRLELSDIGTVDASLLCRLRVHGKGDKERIVWLTQGVLQHVQAWLEERPKTNDLLDEMKHLAEDLPDWLREPIMEHTRRRAARWPDHRLKAQLHMHFSCLCRTGRWLVQNRHWQQLDRLQRSDLVAFVHARQADGWKPRSIASQLTIFRMFWRDMLAEERVSNGAVLQVEAPVADAPLPRYLTNVEYQQLQQVVQQATVQDLPEDRFNQAWFYILAHAGLRLSEARNLRLGDCDLLGKRLRVCAGKGNRDRVIPMTEKLANVLQSYLAVREPASSNHLLIYRKAPVKGTLIPDRLERWGKEAGIQPMTPHRLRHTLATLLINQGMPIASLQKLLGHQDINKTMIYARVHDQTVKEQFSSAMDKIESILITDCPKRMVELESTTPLPDSV